MSTAAMSSRPTPAASSAARPPAEMAGDDTKSRRSDMVGSDASELEWRNTHLSGHVLVLWYLPLHRRYGSRRAASRSVVVRAHDTSEHEVVEEGDTPIVRLRASGSDGQAD